MKWKKNNLLHIPMASKLQYSVLAEQTPTHIHTHSFKTKTQESNVLTYMYSKLTLNTPQIDTEIIAYTFLRNMII